MDQRRLSVLCAVSFLLVAICTAQETIELDPGFMVISNTPEIGRQKDLYIYAITRDYNDQDVEVEFSKPAGLPSDVVKTGAITPPGSPFSGCYLQVKESKRYGGLRFGTYTASFNFEETGRTSVTRETSVKPKTDLLDTSGVYTVTIYPGQPGGTTLAYPVTIGVIQTPGCRKIVWREGKKRNVNTGPRSKLTSTDQAGLYTIHRPTRGQRGWFVQIRVIAASCPVGQYLDAVDGCTIGISCKNGGVLKDKDNACTCPPFFVGADCGSVVPATANCPDGWLSWRSYCYFVITDDMEWDEAESLCVSMGADLASIHCEEENDFVTQSVGGDDYFYIGLNDIDSEGDLVYTDGTEFDFDEWNDDSQPDQSDPEADCVGIYTDGTWITFDCDDDLRAICKRPAEPATADGGIPFTLAQDGDDMVLCRDLPGGNNKCRGHLFCLGDNYGCKCSPGWWGNACDRPCAKGRYGADCQQYCPDNESDCNRFVGPSSNTEGCGIIPVDLNC